MKYAFDVVGPLVLIGEAFVGSGIERGALLEVGGEYANAGLIGGGEEEGGAVVNGCGEGGACIVVGMITEDFNASGGVGDNGGVLSVGGLVLL